MVQHCGPVSEPLARNPTPAASPSLKRRLATIRVESPGTIFQDALHAFSSELSNDPEKLQWIVESKPTDVAAVLAAVKDAQTQYDGRKRDSKTKDALVSLAERMHHYSNIMDVVVSHHPEYTALVWGAMRFFFVVSANCELPRGCVLPDHEI